MDEPPEQPPNGSKEPETPKKKENAKQKLSNIADKFRAPFTTSTPSPRQVPLPDSVPPVPPRRPKSPFHSLGRHSLSAMIPRFMPTVPRNQEDLRATEPTSPEPTAQEAEEMMVGQYRQRLSENSSREGAAGEGTQGKSSSSSENRSHVPRDPPAPPRPPGLPTPSTQPDWETFLGISPFAPTASQEDLVKERPSEGTLAMPVPIPVPDTGDSSSLRTMSTVPYRSLDSARAENWSYVQRGPRSPRKPVRPETKEKDSTTTSETNPFPKDEHGVATPMKGEAKDPRLEQILDEFKPIALALGDPNSSTNPWEGFDDVYPAGQRDQTKADVAGQSEDRSCPPLTDSSEPHDVEFIGDFAHLSDNIATSPTSPKSYVTLAEPQTPEPPSGTRAPQTTPSVAPNPNSSIHPPLDLPFRRSPPANVALGQKSALSEGLLRQRLTETLGHALPTITIPPLPARHLPSLPTPPRTLSPAPSHLQRVNTALFASREASVSEMSSTGASAASQGNGKGKEIGGSAKSTHRAENSAIGPSWPKPAKRANAEVARHRKLILSGIPLDSTANTIHSLVFYGTVEEIQYNPPSNRAVIYFIHADDCDRYFNANPNGIVFKRNYGTEHQPNIREHVIFINRAPEPSPVGGVLRALIEEGATRCVRVSGIGMEWDKVALWKVAEAGGKWRVENVLIGEEKGTRVDGQGNEGSYQIVTFRFCSINHAKMFLGMMTWKEEWEDCNVQFAEDPCKVATDVHFD